MNFVKTEKNGNWQILITSPEQVTTELSEMMFERMREHIHSDLPEPSSPMFATQARMNILKLELLDKEGAPDYAKAAERNPILINPVGGYRPLGDTEIVEQVEADEFPDEEKEGSRFVKGQTVYMGRGDTLKELVVEDVIENPMLPIRQYSFEGKGFVCGEQSIRATKDGRDLKLGECFYK